MAPWLRLWLRYKEKNNTREHKNENGALEARTVEQFCMFAARNLGSSYTALDCGASELIYCETSLGCRMCT